MASSKTPQTIPNAALPAGSLILITGINGLIASHIADQFLHYGYRVRGTARSAEKLAIGHEILDRRHSHGKPAFEDAIVSDMAAEGAFEQAMKGVDGIAHVATDVSFGVDPHKVITPTVTALERILETARKTPSVKRFVYTSSSSAALEPKPNTRFHVDASTWNTESSEIAWKEPYEESFERSFSVYAASKTEAERAAWKFVERKKPGFVLNTILPNLNIGPIFPGQAGSTAGWVRGVWRGDEEMIQRMIGFPPQYWINVVDNAKVHVAAMVMEDVRGERLFTFAGPYNYNDIVDVMEKLEAEGMKPPKPLPNKIEGLPRDLSTVDTARPVELLKRLGQDGWTGFLETMRDNCKDSSAWA